MQYILLLWNTANHYYTQKVIGLEDMSPVKLMEVKLSLAPDTLQLQTHHEVTWQQQI
jgi:hypothetical protein